MKEFLLVNGKVKLTNINMILDKSLIIILKEKMLPLILCIFLTDKIFELYLKITTSPKTIHWIFMVIFCLGLFICIYWLYSSWLKSAWKQNFPVQQIKRVTEERDEAETQLFIAFENGKEVSLNFRTNETYLSDFLKELKQKTNFEHIKQ